MSPQRIAVTGAFSYSGKYITRKLLENGHQVITLTNHPDRTDPFGGTVKAFPYNFDQPEQLAVSLEGIDTLINTYWVRFNHGQNTYHQAITNTRRLFRAAKQAGVRRVVHVSITNPDPYSPLTYFWGKAILEEDLKASALSYTVLRPTVIFGQEDILINNIAWFLRHLPAFGLPGNGAYRLQPIFVEDLARLAANSVEANGSKIIDAIGPETFTFEELVRMIKRKIGSKALLLHTSPKVSYAASSLVGRIVSDIILTREEIEGLMQGLLVTDSPPVGETRLSEWVEAHKESLGQNYANEIRRHF